MPSSYDPEATYLVIDARTGETLEGRPSRTLVEACAKGANGAKATCVGAYRTEVGTWATAPDGDPEWRAVQVRRA
jgi:hypothetical protein